MDPVEGRVGLGVMFGPAAGRQGEEVALLPGQIPAPESTPATAPDHVVDLRRGIGLRPEALTRQDADEVAHSAGLVAGPGQRSCSLRSNGMIRVGPSSWRWCGKSARGTLLVSPDADRVGRLAVLEELRILRPSVDGRLVAGRRGHGYVSSLKSDPSSDRPTAGASRSASRLLRSGPCRIHGRSTAINRCNLILPDQAKGAVRIFSFLLRFCATTGIPTCYPAEADCQQQIGPDTEHHEQEVTVPDVRADQANPHSRSYWPRTCDWERSVVCDVCERLGDVSGKRKLTSQFSYLPQTKVRG